MMPYKILGSPTMKIIFTLFIFILVNPLFADQINRKTVCLNMIVKNESKVITRCLESLKPLIDYWVILDTGSTDNTQEIIKNFMKDIPGELHEEPFVNFEYSRNKALDFAKGKGDYVLFIDADEVFVFDKDFTFPPLEKDFYYIITDFSGMEYGRVQLINNQLNWRWEGVLHEAVDCPDAKESATLEGIKNKVRTDGARSQDPQKFQKDAQLLENALAKDPNNTRYMFYLAQSYKDSGNYAKALDWYRQRIEKGGWDQEVFWSMLEVANMQQYLDHPPEEFIRSYFKAFQYRPSRVEPLYHLANFFRTNQDFKSGYLVAQLACAVPPSSDILFVEKWMHEHGAPIELSICAYWIGKYDEAQSVCLKTLQNPRLAPEIRQCLESNLGFANKKIAEQIEKQLLEKEASPHQN